MRYWTSLLFILLVMSIRLSAQELKKSCAVSLSNIEKSTIDYSGNIFLTNNKGDIIKYNKLCEEQLVFSPSKTANIKNISVWSQFKIFAFYEELQEYIILNRFLTSPIRYDFSKSNVGFVSAATLNFQQNIWVIDEADFTLKLIDSQQGNIITSQLLSQYLDVANHQISDMIEYKGNLYLVDEYSGVFIFDNFGNYIQQISAKGIRNMYLNQHILSYQSANQIIELNLNTLQQDTIALPQGDFSSVFKKSDTFYALSNDELQIYQYLRR